MAAPGRADALPGDCLNVSERRGPGLGTFQATENGPTSHRFPKAVAGQGHYFHSIGKVTHVILPRARRHYRVTGAAAGAESEKQLAVLVAGLCWSSRQHGDSTGQDVPTSLQLPGDLRDGPFRLQSPGVRRQTPFY